jgi:hypothetical protein
MHLPPTMRVVLRFLWYVFSRIFIWGIVVALVVLAFYSAMDFMNAQILTKDGLQLRAEVIIKGDDPTALSKVFSKNFLEQDTLLSSGLYRSYAVTNLDYSAEINFRLIMPWQNTITLRVTEEVKSIEGSVMGAGESGSPLSETPPQWQNAVYNVRLTRFEGNWRIVGMDLVESLPSPTPSPTPTPDLTPTPSPSSSVAPGEMPADSEDLVNDEEIIED